MAECEFRIEDRPFREGWFELHRPSEGESMGVELRYDGIYFDIGDAGDRCGFLVPTDHLDEFIDRLLVLRAKP